MSVVRRPGPILAAVLALASGLAGCSASTPDGAGPPSPVPAAAMPPSAARASSPPATAAAARRYDHIVVVVLENKAAGQVDGSATAPYLNALMRDAAVLTQSRAVTHPSEPNYLALFSGSTHGVTDDRCPLALGDRPNLGRQLLDAGRSFAGYSDGLPAVGFRGCSSGRYAAKHSPWVAFGNLPATVHQPGSAFPTDFTTLPTVAFLIPDLCDDMHDCSVATGDAWLRARVDPYARWAREHNSLLIITFDEDDKSANNHILTMVAGAGVRPGRYAQPVDHYGVLATIEELCGLGRIAAAAQATPIAGIWN